MGSPESNLPPGFRFHPTDEELILHYLSKKVASIPLPVSIIAEVDIYKLDPWELPAKAAFGEKEWYFFSPRDRKYPNGARPNRAAASGYWKATGTDKTIVASLPGMAAPKESIGVKKALVFYKGRPPKGVKTNWIMHEYRLADSHRPIKLKDTSMRLDDWVLCRIYSKSKFTLSSTEAAAEEQLYQDSATPQTQPQPQQNALISQKSVSFSNLLDAVDYSMLSSFLCDQGNNNIEPSWASAASFDQQQHSQQIGGSYRAQKSPQFPCYSMENNNAVMMRPKRQHPNIDGDQETPLHQPSKKYLVNSSCSFPNARAQYENPQWNHVMKQSLLNQQLLLGPHLRFQ